MLGQPYTRALERSSARSIQIGPWAWLMVPWAKVLIRRPGRYQTARAATVGDVHRAAMLAWWDDASLGMPAIRLRGRRVARVEWGGLWALQITEADGSSRIIHRT